MVLIIKDFTFSATGLQAKPSPNTLACGPAVGCP